MRTKTALPSPGLALAALAGIALGVGGFAFAHAKGASYAGNDPATCANCHVMSAQFAAWQNSSHHAVATCNDCHTPAAAVAKYATKAANGYHHSLAFTLGGFPDVVRARPESREVVEGQCRHCHADVVEAMTRHGETSCIRCHDSVGHLR